MFGRFYVSAFIVVFERLQERGAAGGLAQLIANKFGPGGSNARTFVRVVQVILTGVDESVLFDHDKMSVWNERGVPGAVFRDDAATVGESDQHAVPFEVPLIGVMDVEQDFGISEQGVALRGGQITARQFRFGEAERDETQVAIALRKKIRVAGKEPFATRG